jgi:hypothetical protein
MIRRAFEVLGSCVIHCYVRAAISIENVILLATSKASLLCTRHSWKTITSPSNCQLYEFNRLTYLIIILRLSINHLSHLAAHPKAASRSSTKPEAINLPNHIQHSHLQCLHLTYASAAAPQYELVSPIATMSLTHSRKASASLRALPSLPNQC